MLSEILLSTITLDVIPFKSLICSFGVDTLLQAFDLVNLFFFNTESNKASPEIFIPPYLSNKTLPEVKELREEELVFRAVKIPFVTAWSRFSLKPPKAFTRFFKFPPSMKDSTRESLPSG